MVATTGMAQTSERVVSRIWAAQLFSGRKLITDWGQELEVVYPGRPAADHGPDYRDAIVVFDGDLRRGDVEIHRRTGDWHAHRHHCDPRYCRVILHVVFDRDAGPPVMRADGRPVPTLDVRPLLAVPVDEVEGLLDTESPISPCIGPGHQRALTQATLERAGDARLESKVAFIEGAFEVDDPAQVLYELLFEALGYARNKAPFRDLAATVRLRLLEDVALATPRASRREAAQALLFGAAGLLPSQRIAGLSSGESGDACVDRVEARWADMADYLGGMGVAHPWDFFRVRPENYPTRRIVAASELLAQIVEAGLVETFVGLFRRCPPRSIPKELIRALCVGASEPYWRRRVDFGAKEMRGERLLIGRERAIAIAVNVVVPFIFAFGRRQSDDSLRQKAVESFGLFPSPGTNELTRYVGGLLGASLPPSFLRSARAQQGLLHIYHNWCIHKNCGGCPVQ